MTYATRGMEPHRGFPQFMAAVPEILAAPKTVVVVAGANQVAYGGDNLRGVDWKAKALAEADVDPTRVHFVGHLDRFAYLRLLQRSDAHVYLTVPFILSWSMLEAMSCGCPLVLSDTAPVREFADASAALPESTGCQRNESREQLLTRRRQSSKCDVVRHQPLGVQQTRPGQAEGPDADDGNHQREDRRMLRCLDDQPNSCCGQRHTRQRG